MYGEKTLRRTFVFLKENIYNQVKLVLTYNYKDGSEKLMFSEIGNTLRSSEKIDVLPIRTSPNLFVTRTVFGLVFYVNTIEQL